MDKQQRWRAWCVVAAKRRNVPRSSTSTQAPPTISPKVADMTHNMVTRFAKAPSISPASYEKAPSPSSKLADERFERAVARLTARRPTRERSAKLLLAREPLDEPAPRQIQAELQPPASPPRELRSAPR